MRIVSNDGSTVLSHGGVEYVATDGAFDVPQEVGEQLVKFPSFEREYAANDKKTAAEKAAAESHEGILKRIEALEAAVFPNDTEPEPAPAPVPVTEPASEPEPTPEPETPVVEEPIEDVPVQSDASPVDAPPIAEPDAEIPQVETPVEDAPISDPNTPPVEDVPVEDVASSEPVASDESEVPADPTVAA